MLTPTRVTPRMDNEVFSGELSGRKMIGAMLTPTRVTPRMDNEDFFLASCPEKKWLPQRWRRQGLPLGWIRLRLVQGGLSRSKFKYWRRQGLPLGWITKSFLASCLITIRQLAEFRKTVKVALASCPELVDGLSEPTVFVNQSLWRVVRTDNSPKWQLMDNSPVLKCRGCKYWTWEMFEIISPLYFLSKL